MSTVDPKILASHGLHFGHKHQRLHPRARDYVWKNEKGVSIIDLFKTAELLTTAIEAAHTLGSEGKTMIVVATKKQAREIIEELCDKYSIPRLTHRWVGGFLTNFSEISKNIQKMRGMYAAEESGEWNKLVKHERTALKKQYNRIASIYLGVEELKKSPDALFLLDTKREHTAVMEAERVSIPTIAVVDTNCDPSLVTHPIVANDDAVSGIAYITEEILKAYSTGRDQRKVDQDKQKAVDDKKKAAEEKKLKLKAEKEAATPKK